MFGKKKFSLTQATLAAMEAVRRGIEFGLQLKLDWYQCDITLGKLTEHPSNLYRGASVLRAADVTGILRTPEGERYHIIDTRVVLRHYLGSSKIGWEPEFEMCVLVAREGDKTRPEEMTEVRVEWERAIPPEKLNDCSVYDDYRSICRDI